MSGLRPSHPVWLLRRATALEGMTPQSAESPDPARAAVFHRLAAKASAALEGRAAFALTPDERVVLSAEAHALAERAAAEFQRRDGRDLRRTEEWLHSARALREVLEVAGAGEPP